MIDTIEVGELLRQIGVVIARMEERLTRVETQLAARTGTMTASRWAGDSEPGIITEIMGQRVMPPKEV